MKKKENQEAIYVCSSVMWGVYFFAGGDGMTFLKWCSSWPPGHEVVAGYGNVVVLGGGGGGHEQDEKRGRVVDREGVGRGVDREVAGRGETLGSRGVRAGRRYHVGRWEKCH